jgi:hypothetical protein
LAAPLITEQQQRQQQATDEAQPTLQQVEDLAREVLGCPDLLEHILGCLSTPADLGRCATVNKAFRAATPAAGRAFLARTFPAALALEKSGMIQLDQGGLGLRLVRALASSQTDAPEARPPPVPFDAYRVIVEVRSPRRDGVVVFACNGRFKIEDAKLVLLRCKNTVTSLAALLDPASDFEAFHFPGDPIEDPDDAYLARSDSEAEADDRHRWSEAGSDYDSMDSGYDTMDSGYDSEGNRIRKLGFYKRHAFEGVHLTVDITLVRCTDGAVCNFVHGALAFHADLDLLNGPMSLGDLKTMAHGVVISPWTPPRGDRMDDQIALNLAFSVGKTNETNELRLLRVNITPCVYRREWDDSMVALSAQEAAHAFAIADLPWEVSADADYAERLRRARAHSASPAAVTGDAMPAKIWSTLPPPHLLDDYCAMIRVRDRYWNEDKLCFSSYGVLTDDLVTNEDGGAGNGQIFYNAIHSPDAESDPFWNSYEDEEDVCDELQHLDPCDDTRMELEVILVRRSDGAVHSFAHRYCIENAELLCVSFRYGGDGVGEGTHQNFTPWMCDDGKGMCLSCHCEMWADDRVAGKWTHIRLEMFGYRHEEELVFDNGHYLAHALAMLPWRVN